ncbi:twin-arginine translocation signal domain-containing protein [Acidimicrobiaceae bacterium USS-CC1]|uniref:Twin-arginine translocation signal domain-containing protein n=1 Tax=Acidiferrimicrobium australe TaxID=2664430 RepID=A0ABW9QSD5_9ACTN|nr:twin-arginine translocation signal domain-containing protein [Acidiferrimicrobium australe]
MSGWSAPLSRRDLLKAAAAGGASVGAAALLSACGGINHPTTNGTSASAGGVTPTTVPTASGAPKRGGTLRAALAGGDSSDTLNPLALVNNVDFARSVQLFDPLVVIGPDGRPELQLATEITPNADATAWTIRLRPGVTFHNGKDLTADDVVYTFQQMLNPKHPAPTATQLTSVDLKGIRKLDNLTTLVPCLAPFATFVEVLAEPPGAAVIPVGFDVTRPVGTGPFMFESFTAGRQSTFTRNDHYWQGGLPYLDAVIITDFSDETSQVNALQADQADVIDLLSATSVATVKGGGGEVLISDGGAWTPFTMRVDKPPFNDVRVRQAMRLIVDRPQMRDIVFGGYGLLGNDVFAIVDPVYDSALPQRHQDLAQAKHLLKQAGHENLTITLQTGPIAAGATSMATVFAQQAKGAGVNVHLDTLTVTQYYGPNYLSWLFAQDFYYYNPYLPQVAISTLPNSPYNECHFNDPHYTSLYNEALRTVDGTKRMDIAHEMQTIDYEQGGYIIPFFAPTIDGYSKKVNGLRASKTGISLNSFGFKQLWFS